MRVYDGDHLWVGDATDDGVGTGTNGNPTADKYVFMQEAGDPATYGARDLDQLVDSPVILGDIDKRRFEVSGVPHVLATLGEPGPWDHAKAADDVQAAGALLDEIDQT